MVKKVSNMLCDKEEALKLALEFAISLSLFLASFYRVIAWSLERSRRESAHFYVFKTIRILVFSESEDSESTNENRDAELKPVPIGDMVSFRRF